MNVNFMRSAGWVVAAAMLCCCACGPTGSTNNNTNENTNTNDNSSNNDNSSDNSNDNSSTSEIGAIIELPETEPGQDLKQVVITADEPDGISGNISGVEDDQGDLAVTRIEGDISNDSFAAEFDSDLEIDRVTIGENTELNLDNSTANTTFVIEREGEVLYEGTLDGSSSKIIKRSANITTTDVANHATAVLITAVGESSLIDPLELLDFVTCLEGKNEVRQLAEVICTVNLVFLPLVVQEQVDCILAGTCQVSKLETSLAALERITTIIRDVLDEVIASVVADGSCAADDASVCTDNADCSSEGETCIDGVCTTASIEEPECTVDTDCTGDSESCVDNNCVVVEIDDSDCTTDSDCATDELCSLEQTCVAYAGFQYDLTADFSITSNPNGPWSHTAGAVVLDTVSAWESEFGTFATAQPGWADSENGNDRYPFWFKSNGTETIEHDWIEGDVVVHTTDAVNGVNNQSAQLKWVSSFDGVINISGAVWPGRDIGASTKWTLVRNTSFLSSGDLDSGAGFSRDNPFNFADAVAGPNVLQAVEVNAGDVLSLEIRRNSTTADFVGIQFTIDIVSGTTP